ncbi:MAG: hypothetical protein AAFY26_02925 [Cyanobacteria bacterium J06638_22]
MAGFYAHGSLEEWLTLRHSADLWKSFKALPAKHLSGAIAQLHAETRLPSSGLHNFSIPKSSG